VVLNQICAATAAVEATNTLNQLTSRTGGGTVRVAGYRNQTGTVAIAGATARMTSPTNFEGEVIVGVGAYSISVTATNLNNLGSATNVIRTFPANGLDTQLSYDPAGNLLVKSNASQVFSFAWDGANRCTASTNGNLRTALAYDDLDRWSRISSRVHT
jgi:YD repeat-containing protein